MSLLTQFYPGPGGSSSTSYPSSGIGGSPSITWTGVVGSPPTPVAPSNWASYFGLGIYTPSVGAGSQYGTTWNITTSPTNPIKYLLLSNCVIYWTTPTADALVEKIILDGAGFGLSVGGPAPQTRTTEILGTGWLGGSYDSTANWPALTTIATTIEIMPGWQGGPPVPNFRIVGAALDAATVNHILENLVKNGYNTGTTGGILDLSGGTSAGNGALTTAGAAAKAALVAAGWTVTLRP
jgi:hypothetical protein